MSDGVPYFSLSTMSTMHSAQLMQRWQNSLASMNSLMMANASFVVVRGYDDTLVVLFANELTLAESIKFI